MRYPNRRYGNPTAMRHYALWYGSIPELAKALKRSERSVNDWLNEKAKVPWWVPEIMRLQKMEHDEMVRQMTGIRIAARLGVVDPKGNLTDAGARFVKKPPQDAIPPTIEADVDHAVRPARLRLVR